MVMAEQLAVYYLVGLVDVLLSNNFQETLLNGHRRHQVVLHPEQDHMIPLYKGKFPISLQNHLYFKKQTDSLIY